MHICFIIGTLKYSGAEKVLVALAGGLSSLGHQVDVLVTAGECNPLDLHPFKCTSIAVATGPRPLRIARRLKYLRNAVSEIQPDMTISFGHPSNLDATLGLMRNGVPHIACVRTNPNHDFAPGLEGLVAKCIYGLANGLVLQTEQQRKMFRPVRWREDVVIPNPVVEHMSMTSCTWSTERIVALGRLRDADKNFSLLINAFASIMTDYRGWDLVIAGDGPDRALYEELIHYLDGDHRIRLAGSTTHPISFLRQGSVFVLPSKTEGMPNALIEAMSVGLACIATDSDGGGARSLIVSEKNGLLVDNDDESQLERALTRVMSDVQLRERLGRAAYDVNDELAFDRIIERWADYLHGFMD